MVMSTTLPALAERTEGYESSVEAENNFEDGDFATSVMQSDSESKTIAEEVQQETQTGSDSEESSKEQEAQTGSDSEESSKEQEAQTESDSEESSKEQETQTEAATEESEQVQLSQKLLAEGMESNAESPSLRLEVAAELSGKIEC